MKVEHIVPTLALGDGPSLSVPTLCGALASRGNKVTLHILQTVDVETPGNISVVRYPMLPVARRLGISPRMLSGLRNAAMTADILHNHSLWMMPNVYATWAAKGTSAKVVISPRGCFAPAALHRSKWRKEVMWAVAQGRAVHDAHCLHATSEDECRDIRSFGIGLPVAIVPNGVEIPPETSMHMPKAAQRRLLFLGRIHPHKRLVDLVRAWAKLEKQYSNWELRIIGHGSAEHVSFLEKLVRDLQAQRVIISGPVYGEEKARTFAAADLFVLPSSSENFGMAVAEALAHGLPVVVSRGAPWGQIEKEGCGWWHMIGEEGLREKLSEALAVPSPELRAMGSKGRSWVSRSFSWEEAGRRMALTYSWLKGEAERPSWVEG